MAAAVRRCERSHVEESDERAGKTGRIICHSACAKDLGRQAFGHDRRHDRRQSGGDGFEHFVLDTTGDVQRGGSNGGAPEKRTNVGHMPRDLDGRVRACESLHLPSRMGTDQFEPRARIRFQDDGPHLTGEPDRGRLIRCVVHDAAEHDVIRIRRHVMRPPIVNRHARRDDVDSRVGRDARQRLSFSIVHDDRGERRSRHVRLEVRQRLCLASIDPLHRRGRRRRELGPFAGIDVHQVDDQRQTGERRLQRESCHARTVGQDDVGPTGLHQLVEDGSNRRGIQQRVGQRPGSRQGQCARHAVPEAWNWGDAHAVDEATKIAQMRALIAIVDKRHEIDVRAVSQDAQGVVRTNAVASVGGVRQSMSQIEQLHRKTDIEETGESRDKVRFGADFSLGNRCLLAESITDNANRTR